MLTPNYVSKTYHIEYNNFALFRFNLTTTREPMRTVIAKQKIKTFFTKRPPLVDAFNFPSTKGA